MKQVYAVFIWPKEIKFPTLICMYDGKPTLGPNQFAVKITEPVLELDNVALPAEAKLGENWSECK